MHRSFQYNHFCLIIIAFVITNSEVSLFAIQNFMARVQTRLILLFFEIHNINDDQWNPKTTRVH